MTTGFQLSSVCVLYVFRNKHEMLLVQMTTWNTTY